MKTSVHISDFSLLIGLTPAGFMALTVATHAKLAKPPAYVSTISCHSQITWEPLLIAEKDITQPHTN